MPDVADTSERADEESEPEARSDLLSRYLERSVALLRAIEEGELLAAVPAEPQERQRHQLGITLLGMAGDLLQTAWEVVRE